MITGPNSPFSNIPPAVETQVDFISDTIDKAEKISSTKRLIIEATEEAEEKWTELCDEISKDSLFRKTDSWIFGANIAGKKNAVLFFFGGLATYRKILREVVQKGYKGCKPLLGAVENSELAIEAKQAYQRIEFAHKEEKPSTFVSA